VFPELEANCFIRKPVANEDLIRKVKNLRNPVALLSKSIRLLTKAIHAVMKPVAIMRPVVKLMYLDTPDPDYEGRD
jgi:hypothetical protein